MADLPIKPPEAAVPPSLNAPAKESPRPAEKAPESVETPHENAPSAEESRPEPAPAEPEPPTAHVPAARAATPAKDPVTARIEEVLSEDLTDVFLGMAPEKQEAFKRKGEETAGKIRQMIEGAKVNAKKVFSLIREWLKTIPGVNRFFLEQEAKIKTDKILNLKP